MINNLKIKNFKSHSNTSIEFKNLTVFCGGNGVGKSSFIQVLLLLRQTFIERNKLSELLFLNGRLYNIGTVQEALHVNNKDEKKQIIFEMLFKETQSNTWIFNAENNFSFLDLINTVAQNYNYTDLALFNENFQYISAYRNHEQIIADHFEVVRNKQISFNKGKGDMVAHYLYEFGRKIEVIPKLRHPDAKFPFLQEQVNAWESEISSGVEVITEKITENQYIVKYKFKTYTIETPEHLFSAENVGFGLSYTLPIIVAILSAQPGALIIIENPEAHLHPKGISKLTELLCIAAQAGIQVVLETHSDHIINGILVQCKKHEYIPEEGIDRENVSIYQFERNETEHCSIAQKIEVEGGGRIFGKPSGFFDQISQDLKQLMR